MQTKWVIVTGGIMSGLGKGIAAASIGRLLKDHRKIVTVKCDGYLNVDPGTMNPVEHGEVFVLDDGGEVDMDFGHYERFLDVNCKFSWNLTSGKIFDSVIQQEREGKYLGKTIQIFPHVIDEIKQRLFSLVKDEKADIAIIEIGGTLGDIENSWFVEAVRQLKYDVGTDNILYVHLTYIPYLHNVGELKTKPAQRDIMLLRENGINPDIVIGRCKQPLTDKIKTKISMFCDIPPDNIIAGIDVDTIYDVPLNFMEQGMVKLLHQKFHYRNQDDLGKWKQLVKSLKEPKYAITVAICGKYTELHDSYASVIEALRHAGAHLKTKVHIQWLETTDIEKGKQDIATALQGVDAVIVPGGFGSRGVEGKIKIVEYVRKHNIPYLGLCYGLQIAIIEFARNVSGLENANTSEIDKKTQHPVIDFLPEQKVIDRKGGTMRLGGFDCELQQGTRIQKLYGTPTARERHRHRYEVNPAYHKQLLEHGMVFSGTSSNGKIVEFIELKDHPYFVATQAHNELTSRLERPNPLFYGLVKAANELKKE